MNKGGKKLQGVEVPLHWRDPKNGDVWALAVLERRKDLRSTSNNPFDGRSPRKLRGPTFGDTLKNHDGRSRVVSVALKDRAAILMGGYRADEVLWFDRSGRWTTSRYYRSDGILPPWLQTLNTSITSSQDATYRWSHKSSSGRVDDGPQAVDVQVRQKTYQALSTPYGDQLTLQATKAAMRAHKLGQDEVPDALWVSFSSFDRAGHRSGPNTATMEGMFLAADRAVADLLNHLEAHVPGGLDAVVVAVTVRSNAPEICWPGCSCRPSN